MARLHKKAIETFMSITGESDAIAVQKLEEHGGDLNEAVNAHFNGGDISTMQETSSVIVPQNGAMDIDEPIQVGFQEPPFSIFGSARNLSPFSLIDPDFRRGLFNSGPDFTSREPVVSHPREVKEILIGVKDGGEQSGHSSLALNVEDVTGTSLAQGQETQGSYIIDDDDDEDISTAPSGQNEQNDDFLSYNSRDTYPRPSAPRIDDLSGYKNDIEEEMVRAAIEASKREVGKDYNDQQLRLHDDLSNSIAQQKQSGLEDPDLAHAVSLSLKTAEQEKALRQLRGKVGESELEACKTTEVGDMGEMTSSNGRPCRLNMGSSSIQDDVEAIEEQPLSRHKRSMRMSSASVDSGKELKEVEVTQPSSPRQHDNIDQLPNNRKFSPTDEWGGISSEEQDEAIMLEAALFGGIPEGGSGYGFPFAPHQLMQNGLDRNDDQQIPHPPSPGLTAQRLIREQQDDEYLLSLQADREKELKAMEEAKVWHLEEQAAREVSFEEERRKEEELHRKLEEEQEIEKQLAAKESSLPQEPTPDDENAVTLLVRMPDGSRRGRRFLKSDKLQSLFDFIDVGRWVKPGSYRLVRPYPRRAFDDGESDSTLNQQGLTNKQEALFMELI